jgi:hypothetical protein
MEVIALRKELEESADQLLADCRKHPSCARGSKANGWEVNLWLVRGTLRARLLVDGSVVMGLDHHDFLGGGIPEGYHWDVHPPLSPLPLKRIREYIQPQPSDVESALELSFSRWHIFLRPDGQLRMR